jgi:hypothetical protein
VQDGAINASPYAELFAASDRRAPALDQDRAAGAQLDGYGALVSIFAQPKVVRLGIAAVSTEPARAKIDQRLA